MLKIIKMIGWFLVVLVVGGVGGGLLFLNISPEFGGNPTREQRSRYAQLDHYDDGKFVNLIPTSMDMSLASLVSVLGDYIKGVPDGTPDSPPPVVKVDSLAIAQPDTLTRITWLGHSAVLLEIDGKKVLLDPMLGDVPAPHPWLGSSRFNLQLPIEIEKLPQIDAVLISHDHYDHLDYESIRKLKEKVQDFYVPLGVGAHLRAWGVSERSIHELDWWDEIDHGSLRLVFAPSRHFSGRGLADRNTTLWGSWVIKGTEDKLYFSGDSGYGPHFAKIGERYGPFDLAMIECGQYDRRWAQIHMMPEESAQAAVDVGAEFMVPIHWGAFRLALHPWTDPIVRVTARAEALNLVVATPRIGEAINLNERRTDWKAWWMKD